MSFQPALPSFLLLSLVLALACPSSAQVTYSHAPGSPSIGTSTYLPTAAYPAGTAAADINLVNASGLTPIVAVFGGGMASDDRNGIIYTSNGVDMAMDQNLTYAGFGPLPLVPAGTSPILIPFGFSPVSGLAFDDAANQLWACGSDGFWPASPVAPFGPLALPIGIPGLLSPVTGLGYDPGNNTLWACDTLGFIYHFDTLGSPIGVQPVNSIPATGVLNGVAVSTGNGLGAFPTPPCSTQVPGYHVTVSDGFFVYDALSLAPPIPMTPLVAGNTIWGHTFSSDFQVKRCPTPGSTIAPPLAGTERVNYVGTGAPQSLRCIGASPLTTGYLIADLCPTPTCFFGLWFSPFTWTLAGISTDAFGEVTFPVSFTFLPPGVQFSFQWAIFDPSAVLGYAFSNACTVTVGLP